MLVAATFVDLFTQDPDIKRFMSDFRRNERGASLTMEAIQLIQKIELGPGGCLDRIQGLHTGFEAECLNVFVSLMSHQMLEPLRKKNQTLVSVTNGIFQSLGGTILQRPYCSAWTLMDEIYPIGSLNSSEVGKYVGQSSRPNGRWPTRVGSGSGRTVLTVDKSRGLLIIGVLVNGATFRGGGAEEGVEVEDDGEAERRSAARASTFDFRGARLPSIGVSTEIRFTDELAVALASIGSEESLGDIDPGAA